MANGNEARSATVGRSSNGLLAGVSGIFADLPRLQIAYEQDITYAAPRGNNEIINGRLMKMNGVLPDSEFVGDEMPDVEAPITRDILEGKYFVTSTFANDESLKMRTCGRIVKSLASDRYYVERLKRNGELLFGIVVLLREMEQDRWQIFNDENAWNEKIRYEYGLID